MSKFRVQTATGFVTFLMASNMPMATRIAQEEFGVLYSIELA